MNRLLLLVLLLYFPSFITVTAQESDIYTTGKPTGIAYDNELYFQDSCRRGELLKTAMKNLKG